MKRTGQMILAALLACGTFAFPAHAGNGLNDLFGIQLWGGGSLWEDVASDTAVRLKLSDHENQSQNQNLNNGYFRANLEKSAGLQVMGARVYSIEIYSSNQKVTRVVFGFVNRADLISEMEAGADKSKVAYNQFMVDFESRLAREREAAYSGMSAKLTKTLGAPAAGTAPSLRQWSWQKNLLTLENAELALTLRIEPIKSAPAPTTVTTAQRKSQNLRTRTNGDTVVTGIPPISQGPRGFCVPASWEKCLRYHGLNMDVYQLGEKGGTDYYGSAFIPFAAKIAPLLEPEHFKMQLLKRDALGMDLVKTYVDQALPLIWCLNASRMYYWVERSRKRSSFLDDNAEGLPKDPRTHYISPGGHALLIIGYNASLKEIALSDSTELGSGEGEIWIRESDMLAMALPDGLVAVLPEDNPLNKEMKFTRTSVADRPVSPSATPQGRKWY